MCVGKLSANCLGLSDKTGMRPTSRTGSTPLPAPITPSAWLPMVHTGEEKPVIQYPSSTFTQHLSSHMLTGARDPRECMKITWLDPDLPMDSVGNP